MKIVTNIKIDRPLADTMALMSDQTNTTKWMYDLESYVAAKDNQSARFIFKNGMVFTFSPLSNGSNELRSKLEGKSLAITTVARFKNAASQETELYFEQEFTFKGIGKLMGLFARSAIQRQQQKHMQDLKSFVEDQIRATTI